MDLDRIDHQPLRARLDARPHPLPLRLQHGGQLRGDVRKDRCRTARVGTQNLLSGVEAGEPQQVRDQPLHAGGMARNDVEKPLARSDLRLVRQRVHRTANRRQRRSQLVGDVGHEVLADLHCTAIVAHVVQHDDHAGLVLLRVRRGARQTHPDRLRAQRDFRLAGPAGFERTPDLLRHFRMPDQLDIVAVDGRLLDLQHAAYRVVGHLHQAAPVHDEHALGHAGENCIRQPAASGQLRETAAELLHGGVERPGHRADLVVPVRTDLRRQVSRRIAPRHRRDHADAPAHRRRSDPGEDESPGESHQQPAGRAALHRRDLVVDRGQRQRQPDERHAGMIDPHGRVQQVALHRRAVAAGHPDASRPGEVDLGPGAVVLHRRQRRAVFGRIADDAPARLDDGHPRAEAQPQRIGLPVQLGDGGTRSASRDEIGHQPRLGHQDRRDPVEELPLEQPGHERGGQQQAETRDTERSKKQPGAESHAWADGLASSSTSLYPNCFTVTIAPASIGSFSRSRRMWTSTVRVPPV